MIDIRMIKLVVWDLDDTFWKGTFSEGDVVLPDGHVRLIIDLTNAGIINSICSKNEFEPTKEYLQKLGVWDYFVFPSINWHNKGPQLKEKIDKMALRPVNVLFLDDNPSNLGEAKHYLPDLQVGGPEIIEELIEQIANYEKKDLQHKRLKQYKVLEEKDAASKTYASSEDFLYASLIQVKVHKDCCNQIQRIHELLMRSNQLNYTKKRISLEELETVLKDPDYDCGYVTVKDRFGDYGVVGFYAMINGRLEHFLFSCRTMGQKIEQWVYAYLGFPQLEVVGEVRTCLNMSECPQWINHTEGDDRFEDKETQNEKSHCKVLVKGPCDLSHALVYIKNSDLFDTEFTYVSNADGQIIDAYNHSVHIEGLYTYTEKEKAQIVEDCIFVDPCMLDGGFFTKGYDVIFLSTLIETDYSIFIKRGSNIRVVYGGLDLTFPGYWQDDSKDLYYSRGNIFTKEYLRVFSEKYECIGKTTPKMYIEFLKKCLSWLPSKTTLCLILGATKVFEGQEEVKSSHKALNDAIKNWAKAQDRIRLIEIDNCVKDTTDFVGGINHFSAKVYYEIAQRMIEVIAQNTGRKMATYSSKIVLFDRLVLKLRESIKNKVGPDMALYSGLKSIYDKVYKHRK